MRPLPFIFLLDAAVSHSNIKELIMFEIFRANGGGYFWHLKAANGEKLCHSEVYTTKQSAEAGIEAVKRIAPGALTMDRTEG